jgi:LDH2 family malate/lactate/ureidoglycolate dehydrogenase
MSMGLVVDCKSLEAFATQVFVAAGLPPQDAAIEAEVLIWANLRGVDSHGVLRIPSYVSSIENGGMNPRPNIQVVQDTPAMSLIDADWAFGPVVTTFAMERAIGKAKNVGIGWMLIRNTTHQGAIGYYALMAAKEGMAGIAVVCSPPNMAPYAARVPGVHNSPIAIAVPGNEHRPLVLDMATSVAAGGKVSLAIDKGVEIPEGWALDKEGQPTRDPTQVGALLPAGSYKGSGLAMMFECLTSLFVGNPLLARRLAGKPIHGGTQNSFVAAIDIATFTDLEAYQSNVDETIDRIKAIEKADGFDEILVPGEPEDQTHETRAQHGIPLPDGTVRNLLDVAEKLGIPAPEWLHT